MKTQVADRLTFKQTIKIPQEQAAVLQSFLDESLTVDDIDIRFFGEDIQDYLNRQDALIDELEPEEMDHESYTGVIATFTVKFSESLELAIDVGNEEYPYIESILFVGDEDGFSRPHGNTLLGEYSFEYEGNTYIALLVSEGT